MSEGIGEALRQAFEARLEALGQPFIVHSNINTPHASQIEVNGLIKSEGRNTGRMVFQFLVPIDVKAGSILQIKGGRDFWKVIDTEDVVKYGVLVKFEVYVEKVNIAGQPTRFLSRGNTTYKTDIHLSNSTVGILNTGEIEDVQSISVNVSTLAESGHAEMSKAIKELTEAVAASQELSADERAYVLENLEELSKQALLPSNERAKSGVIKSLMAGVGGSLSAAGGLAEVWSTWGSAIRAFFGF